MPGFGMLFCISSTSVFVVFFNALLPTVRHLLVPFRLRFLVCSKNVSMICPAKMQHRFFIDFGMVSGINFDVFVAYFSVHALNLQTLKKKCLQFILMFLHFWKTCLWGDVHDILSHLF